MRVRRVRGNASTYAGTSVSRSVAWSRAVALGAGFAGLLVEQRLLEGSGLEQLGMERLGMERCVLELSESRATMPRLI